MSDTHTSAAPSAAIAGYLSRIEAHLARLAEGHDPLGHLFAIERLARSARAEWWAAQHEVGRGRHGPVAR